MATKKTAKDDKRYPAAIEEKPLKKVTKKSGAEKTVAENPVKKSAKK